jgi:hypothetical protein
MLVLKINIDYEWQKGAEGWGLAAKLDDHKPVLQAAFPETNMGEYVLLDVD